MLPIVVNPLLWYVHEQMKQIPTEVLLKVVVSYYSIEDIEKAKNIIFENFPEENRPRKLQRKINRQGQNKADNNVKDIVEMFHEMAIADGFKTPIFVTANTDFPPLSIAGVDVTALKQDMAVLQKDFLQMQQAKLQDNTELNDIKQAVDELKSLLMKQQNSPAEVNLQELQQSGCIVTQKCVASKPSYSNICKKQVPVGTNFDKELENECDRSKLLDKPYDKSKVLPGTGNKSNHKGKNGMEWKTVQKHVRKNFVGKSQNSGIKSVCPMFKPAEVFLSRIHPDTKEDEILVFAKKQFQNATDVQCEKLSTKYNTYNSFKVSLSGIAFRDSVNLNNWPEGILVKRYFAPKTTETQVDLIKETPTTGNQIVG